MTSVISAACCYEHTHNQKKKGVFGGGDRMLRRWEAGKGTSGLQIIAGEKWTRCGEAVGGPYSATSGQDSIGIGNGVRREGTQKTEK